MKSFTHEGHWFLPSKGRRKRFGTLRFDIENGGELEIKDRLEKEEQFHPIDREIIIGTLSNGTSVTLYKCYRKTFTSFSNVPSVKYSVIFIFLGAHFKEVSQLSFNMISSSFDTLDEWLRIGGFQEIKPNFKERSIKIDYKPPELVPFKITDDLIGEFDFSFSYNTESKYELSMEQTAIFSLKVKRGSIPFDEILEELFHFQKFLTFGTFTHSLPTNLQLFSTRFKYNSKYYKEINLFFKSNVQKSFAIDQKWHEFLLTYSDIKENLKQIIEKWYSLKEEIIPVINLLVDSINNPLKFDENTFLNIVQAAETFHRRFKNNLEIPIEKHKKRIDEIINSVDANHKKWLKEKLNFSNEPTLKKRLEELTVGILTDTLKKYLGDKEEFIKSVKNSRNYYTHYGYQLQKKALKGNDLYYATEKMKIILSLNILIELGIISSNNIEEFLKAKEIQLFRVLRFQTL